MDAIKLTDFGLFQEHGLAQGDIPVSIWLTNLSRYNQRFHEAQLNRSALYAGNGEKPIFGTTSRKQFEAEYVKIGNFYLSQNEYDACGGLNDPHQRLISWCYSIASQWPEYKAQSRRIDFETLHQSQLESFAKQVHLPLLAGNGGFWEHHKSENGSAFVQVPLRGLKVYIGDVLEIEGEFLMILGYGFARLNILS